MIKGLKHPRFPNILQYIICQFIVSHSWSHAKLVYVGFTFSVLMFTQMKPQKHHNNPYGNQIHPVKLEKSTTCRPPFPTFVKMQSFMYIIFYTSFSFKFNPSLYGNQIQKIHLSWSGWWFQAPETYACHWGSPSRFKKAKHEQSWKPPTR